METVLETLARLGGFATLRDGLERSGLTAELGRRGAFTMFAPPDAAFAQLPEAMRREWQARPARLAALLAYHIVPRRVAAADLMLARSLVTLRGYLLSVDAQAGLRVSDAYLTDADHTTDAGLIHIIDRVLLPAW